MQRKETQKVSFLKVSFLGHNQVEITNLIQKIAQKDTLSYDMTPTKIAIDGQEIKFQLCNAGSIKKNGNFKSTYYGEGKFVAANAYFILYDLTQSFADSNLGAYLRGIKEWLSNKSAVVVIVATNRHLVDEIELGEKTKKIQELAKECDFNYAIINSKEHAHAQELLIATTRQCVKTINKESNIQNFGIVKKTDEEIQREDELVLTSLYLANAALRPENGNDFVFPPELFDIILQHYVAIKNFKFPFAKYIFDFTVGRFDHYKKPSQTIEPVITPQIKPPTTALTTTAVTTEINQSANSTQTDDRKQLMVVAPIKSGFVIQTLKQYQQAIATRFKFNKNDPGEEYFHISFAAQLIITLEEEKKLHAALSKIILPNISIKIVGIKSFPNGTIYAEIEDSDNQLEKLNTKIISAIKGAGIECNPKFNFIPHITLFFMQVDCLTSEQLREVEIQHQQYFITSVVVSESTTDHGVTQYKESMELPHDALFKASEMEQDFLNGGKLFLTSAFDHNPLADYYRMMDKLNQYRTLEGLPQSEENDAKKKQLQMEAHTLFRKILDTNNPLYAKDPVTHALKQHARGLIYQFYDQFQLITGKKLTDEEINEYKEKALPYLKEAYRCGYRGSLYHLGKINYDLRNYQDAHQYLVLTLSIGNVNAKTVQSCEFYIEDIENNKSLPKRKENNCVMM